jgi:hypothetical protein
VATSTVDQDLIKVVGLGSSAIPAPLAEPSLGLDADRLMPHQSIHQRLWPVT